MPVINQYTRQNLPRQMLQTRASAASFGAYEGQALQGLGQAAENLSAKIQEVQNRRDELEYHKKLTDFKIETIQRAEEVNRTATGDLFEAHNKDLQARADAFEVPESMRERFQVDLDNIRLGTAQTAIAEQARRAAAAAKANWEDIQTQNENLVLLDPSRADEAIQTLKQASGTLRLDPSTRGAIVSSGIDRIRAAQAKTLATNTPEQFIADAKAGKYNDVPNIDGYINRAEAQIKTAKADAQAAVNKEATLFESQIDLKLATATTPAEIADLQNEIIQNGDKIGAVKRNDLLTKTVAAQKKFDEEFNGIQRGGMFASGEAYLNPADTDDKKDFNTYYEKILEPALSELEPDQRNSQMVKLIDETKVIPDRLKGDIISASKSRDPEVLSSAADFIDRLRMQNPHMLESFPQKDVARLDLINQYATSGYTPTEAIQRADEALKPVNENVRAMRKEQLKAAEINYRDNSLDVFNTWFSRNVNEDEAISGRTIANVTADYRRAYESQYEMTGDADVSQRHAESVVRGRYQRTEVNGFPQIMAYAPDKYYGISGDSEPWIRRQMIETAKEAAKDIMTQEPINMEKDLFLTADPFVTARTAKNGQPAYKILYRSSDGTLRDLLGNNKYFIPDVGKRRQQLIEQAKNKESPAFNFPIVTP